MKTNFALSLSFDGLRLLHRAPTGWEFVGEVSLEEEDVSAALARLRDMGLDLEPGGIATKLLITNEQIKYLTLADGAADEAAVRAALNGATPYGVDDLVYDYVAKDNQTYVAAVARETLREAQEFATENGFNPICFAAIPDPFTFVGEAFFGPTAGNTAERDAKAVVVTGVSKPKTAQATPKPDAPKARPTEVKAPAATPPVSVPPVKTPTVKTPTAAPPLRAERAAAKPATKQKETAKGRVDPIVRKSTPTMAVAQPGDAIAAPAPDLAAPNRDTPAVVPTPQPIKTQGQTPDTAPPDTAPPVTGEAATAGAVQGSLGGVFASRRSTDGAPEAEAKPTKDAARQTVFGANKATKAKRPAPVGGKPRFLGLILTAILLVFLLAIAAFAALSEEGLARWFGLGDAQTDIAAPGDTPAQTDVVAVAAPTPPTSVAPAEDVALQPPDVADADVAETPVSASPPVSASTTSVEDTPSAEQPQQTAADSTAPTPEDALRSYAATGVWQRGPIGPDLPASNSLDDLALDVTSRPVARVPSSPLADAETLGGDAVIAAPIDPPSPETPFDFDATGRVAATPEGALTPDGILIFAGRPSVEPPVRPGTIAPAALPQDQLAAVVPETGAPLGDAPEGVILIAGRPTVTPPIRPGTQAPVGAATAPLVATDGLIVLAGAPPAIPPLRPQTEAAPTADAEILDPETDPASGIAQTPDATTLRPIPRPGAIAEAAVAADTPILGDLTVAQAAAFRPSLRPAGLAPAPEPEPEAQAEAATPNVETPSLELAPEIAAAVQAAANRPNPIVNPTAQAIPVSARPDARPRNMARIVDRANQAQQQAATQVAAAAPRAVAPSGATVGSVAQAATVENAINLRDVNLIGIFGSDSDRRALVRLGNGRLVRVTVGDRLDGGRVTAISAGALSYTKGGRAVTLQVAG